MVTVREQGRKELKNHDGRGEGYANADHGSELAKSGQAAEVENSKRRDGGESRPEDAWGNRMSDLRDGEMRLSQSLLVMNDSVIYRKAKEDGGKPDTDNIHCSEDESADGQGAGESDGEQEEQP